MEIFIGWLVLSLIVGAIAGKRGRSSGGWALLALVISPLLAVLILLVLQDRSRGAALAAAEQPTPETHVRCPDCRELVRAEARRCKHCGITLIPQK